MDLLLLSSAGFLTLEFSNAIDPRDSQYIYLNWKITFHQLTGRVSRPELATWFQTRLPRCSPISGFARQILDRCGLNHSFINSPSCQGSALETIPLRPLRPRQHITQGLSPHIKMKFRYVCCQMTSSLVSSS